MPHRGDQRVPQPNLTFYPAYCYRNSPTWFVWAKLTCFEVHNILRPGPSQTQTYTSGPSTNLTLFYLNHPIQYIQVTGVVVAIDDTKESKLIVTLDDSSGSTLEVVVWKPRPKPTHISTTKPTPAALSHTGLPPSVASSDTLSEAQTTALNLLTLLRTLEIGTALRAKGTVTTFHSTRQLSLLRATPVTSTNAELALIASRTAFNSTILSKPWVVSRSRQERLLRIEHGEKAENGMRERKRRERKKKIEERERRHEGRIMREWEEEERGRAEAAEAARRDGEEAVREKNLRKLKSE